MEGLCFSAKMSDDIIRDTIGGARRDRTDDLYNAIVALSQLSYGPLSRVSDVPCAHHEKQAKSACF